MIKLRDIIRITNPRNSSIPIEFKGSLAVVKAIKLNGWISISFYAIEYHCHMIYLIRTGDCIVI